MKHNSHYTPTENGYSISGSAELFNRTLYGSHKNDDKDSKFCTFAGDAPQFMGALTNWKENSFSYYSKCGTLTSGLALTSGQRVGFFYSDDIDISSRWFHNSEDVASEYKNGWFEYELSQISPWFADVEVNIEAYPLLPDDGFLVHYTIKTDQRIIFAAGFGGITDYIGRFEYKDEKKRYFHASDCAGNKINVGKNCASVFNDNGMTMHIGTNFDADVSIGSAEALESPYPSSFLGNSPENENDQVVKISSVIEAGETFNGFIVVLYNSDDEVLKEWQNKKDAVSYIKQQIYRKFSCINMKTPELPLDLTIAPTVISLDASWHSNSFHHGAFGYHAPFLGWRNWYAPTALGWRERVEKTIATHLNQIMRSNGEENVRYDGKRGQYHTLSNTDGCLPYFIGDNDLLYNMQECAFDMMMYYIEWTGNLDLAEKYYDELCDILDWEDRILDPDGDGLYQNYLNTWISDGHSYNGAGCAQSSAYNYRANCVMAIIANKLGKSNDKFVIRAEKIKKAIYEKLWIANKGIVAESLDTIGNCLIHPSPELSTAYLLIDCDVVNDFQSYTILKFTENNIKSIITPNMGGRLSYSSDWKPKKYSTYGIFPSENAHLALVYFKLGLKEEGKKILDGITDCYFSGKNPGMAAHVQSSRCTADLADLDFTDVSSTYLRLIIEGLFGIRFNALENYVSIAPGFPEEWGNATLTLKDISFHYNRMGNCETYEICCSGEQKKIVRIPMRSSSIEAVLLDGEPVLYDVKAAVGNSFLIVEIENSGRSVLQVMHGKKEKPTLLFMGNVFAENDIMFEVKNGDIIDIMDISESLTDITVCGRKIYAKTKNIPGKHTLFVRTKSDIFDSWLAADYEILKKDFQSCKPSEKPFESIDISKYFNSDIMNIHNQEYMSPRPEGYSIGVCENGRYGWEWNHGGHNKLVVDDTSLRKAGGSITTKSGISFITPSEGKNVACVSIWDNFPNKITFDINDKGEEIAIMFISTTNCMQTAVENARITVCYADGGEEKVSLIYPVNIDDWLVPSLQTENETFYFNDYNHATVQKIHIDKTREVKSVVIEAVANEVIIGVMGISIIK